MGEFNEDKIWWRFLYIISELEEFNPRDIFHLWSSL